MNRGFDARRDYAMLYSFIPRLAFILLALGGLAAPAAAVPLLVILAIGTTDLVFAVDSIPAVFGLTTSAYIVFAVNAFALMGLRQLYFLLHGLLDQLLAEILVAQITRNGDAVEAPLISWCGRAGGRSG